MSYIDKEKALEFVLNNTPHINGETTMKCVERAMKAIPTADVVEVVRCKDCKHNPQNGGECDRSITHTGRDYVCEVNTYRYIGIDYCSHGERSENGT